MKRNKSGRRYAACFLLAVSMAAAQAQEISDLEKIRASGELKIAVYLGNAPYSDGSQQSVSGVDVELGKALAEHLHLKARFLPFSAGDRLNDDLRNMVWRGTVLGYGPADVMLHVPVDKYMVRDNPQALVFAPYQIEKLVLFYRKKDFPDFNSINDLKNFPLATEEGSGASAALLGYAEGLLREKVELFKSGISAAESVISGKSKAAYITRAQAEEGIFRAKQNVDDWAMAPLDLPGMPKNGWVVGMAVKRGNEDLAQEIENSLKSIRESGKLLGIFRSRGVSVLTP